MSDITIPGVTASKYKTDELIEGLMKVERIPRDRADEDLKTYKKQQAAWRTVNQQSTTLRDTAKSLYSYDNPFNEKTSSSTNERAITATASKEAKDQSFKVSVSQIAAADSFLSAEIATGDIVAKGDYEFAVGDKTVSFAWKGGTYRDFVDALNRRGTGIVQASIIKITDKTQSILVESLKTGAKERLSFSKDALTFALNAGLIRKNDASAVESALSEFTAGPVSSKTVEFSATARARDSLVLEYTISASEAGTLSHEESPSSGPEAMKPGSVTYGGITIENLASETALAEPTPAEKPTPVTDDSVLSLRSTKGIAIPLPALPAGGAKTTVTVPLSEYGDVNAILAHNRNTEKTLRVENIRIYDPAAAGEYAPVNPVSIAQDAMLKYEGIPVTRATNDIDDLIPGVTLNVHEPTDKTETLTVKPDTETAKESIITFVANYNRVMAEINILTQSKPEVITELQYFTDAEKKAADERLGMFIGDTTLNGLKSSLQRITSSNYRTGESSAYTLLSQIGISTKSSAGAGIESSRLRGYLEIDEKKLDEALKNNIASVKSLFGSDSDGDLIVDTGIGQSLDANLAAYVQTGGIIGTRNSGLATRITATEKKIEQYDAQLKTKEADLKSKYGQMEGTLNSLQSQSNSISNFANQGNK